MSAQESHAPATVAVRRIQVQAQAWADGYAAGRVDEFHGVTRPNPCALDADPEDGR